MKKKNNILPYSWLGIGTNHKKYVELKFKFEQICKLCKWCGLTLEQHYKIEKKVHNECAQTLSTNGYCFFTQDN